MQISFPYEARVGDTVPFHEELREEPFVQLKVHHLRDVVVYALAELLGFGELVFQLLLLKLVVQIDIEIVAFRFLGLPNLQRLVLPPSATIGRI